MGSNAPIIVAVSVVVVIVGLLLVIILPLSFNYVEYYEYGLKKQRSTGKVDRDKVYTMGRYSSGPDYTFETFPADAHVVVNDQISVWSRDKLSVEISCQYEYFLLEDHIGDLHEQFDDEYRHVLENNALNAIKDTTATHFDVRELFRNRARVEQKLFEAVRERLGGNCCFPNCQEYNNCVEGCKTLHTCTNEDKGLYAEVRYFQLQYLDIPTELRENFLKQLIELQKNEIAKYKQTSQLVRKATDEKVQDIENMADQVYANSTARANLIKNKARANAEAIVEDARSRGLLSLYEKLNITTQEHRQRFDYLRTLRNQEKAHLTVGYSTLVAGPLK